MGTADVLTTRKLQTKGAREGLACKVLTEPPTAAAVRLAWKA